MRKLIAVLSLLLALPVGAQQQGQQPFQYTELNPPVAVETKGKVEVVEFFWYGCIHCYNLEPQLETWSKKLPPDVEFRRIPAVFSERWAHDAAIFYALEAIGQLDRLHKPLFDAIHKDRLRTDNPAALTEWLQRQKVDPKKFNDALRSFGVQSKTRRAAQQTVAYKIDGTPAMAVHGRYVVSAQPNMLQAIDSLVDNVRKQK